VDDDGHAVAREAHVELDAVGAAVEGALEGDEGVLGRERGGAAVADDERRGGGQCLCVAGHVEQ
jgi:hypothetical protein